MQCENNIFDVAVGLQSIIIIIKCADKWFTILSTNK